MLEASATCRRIRCGCLILHGHIQRSPEALPCPNPDCPSGSPPGEHVRLSVNEEVQLEFHPAVEWPIYIAHLRRLKAISHHRAFWGWELVAWEKVSGCAPIALERAHALHALYTQATERGNTPAATEQRSTVEWELHLRGTSLDALRHATEADNRLRKEWGLPPYEAKAVLQ